MSDRLAKALYQEPQNASKEYDNSTKSATRTYEERYWTAYENAYQSAVDAAIANLEAELDYETALYEQALQDYNDEYDGALDDMEDAINDVGKPKPGVSPIENYDLGDWWNDNSLGIGTINLTKPLAQAEANNYGTLLEIDFSFYKGQIEEQAKAREIRGDKDFSNKSNDFCNEYSSKLDTAYGNYLEKHKTLESEYSTAIDEAVSTYNATLTPTREAYDEFYCNTLGRYHDALKILDSGGTIEAEFFENGATNVEFQVCFAAGTKLRLDHGEEKVVEEFKRGDVFSTPDQHDPEGKHILSEVVEVYHNDPQPVCRLLIENAETRATLVLRATKEHPFYVTGKGWTSVLDLEIGDCFLSKSGSRNLVLREKELEPEPVPVYSIQVKSTHTYFVGESDELSVLVHNACPDVYCGHYRCDVQRAAKGPSLSDRRYSEVSPTIGTVV